MAVTFWRTVAPRAVASSLRKLAEASFSIHVLSARADFVRLRAGRRSNAPSFLLQSAPNGRDDARVGFTVTKKIGNAVCRNRIKRRFRAAAQAVMPDHAKPGHDYVLIARPGAQDRAWAALLDDMRGALKHADMRGTERSG